MRHADASAVCEDTVLNAANKWPVDVPKHDPLILEYRKRLLQFRIARFRPVIAKGSRGWHGPAPGNREYASVASGVSRRSFPPSSSRVKSEISRIAVQIDAGPVDRPANSPSESGLVKISSVFPSTPMPAEITDLVHDFGRTGPAVGQIAAVKHQIGRHIPEVLQNRFERRSISVDIGQDRDYAIANDLPSYRLR